MTVAESIRLRRDLVRRLRSATGYGGLLTLARTIDDLGLLDHDRMLCWDAYAAQVRDLRGLSWKRDAPVVPRRRAALDLY